MDLVERAAAAKSDEDSELDSDWEDSSDEDEEKPKTVQPVVNKKRDARLAKKAEKSSVIEKKTVIESAHDAKTGKLDRTIVEAHEEANTPKVSAEDQVSRRIEIERLNRERELEFAKGLMEGLTSQDLDANEQGEDSNDAQNRQELTSMGAAFGEKVGSFSFSAFFPDLVKAFLSEACSSARSEHIAEIMNHMISLNNAKLNKGKKKKKRGGKKGAILGREDAYGGYGVELGSGIPETTRAKAGDDAMLMDAMATPLVGSSSDDEGPTVVRQDSDDDFM